MFTDCYNIGSMEIQRARYSRQNRGNKKRANIPLLFGIALFFVSIGGYSFAALTKPLPELMPKLTALQATVPHAPDISWPAGQGVVGTVEDGVLAASSETELVRPIASMTKLVTALAVLEVQPLSVGDLGVTYTITQRDVDTYHSYVARYGTILPVRIGQQITQYHALQGLLLPSANNISDLLAEREFGSMDEFLIYANNMLASFGLQNTLVADASGFSPQTVSTPSDMFEIGRRALAHPVIAEIVKQKEATIPVSGTVRNTNLLLADESVIGLKTGTTDEAGSCLLFAFRHVLDDGSTKTVIAVVMGVPTWPQLYREVARLIDTTKQGFAAVEVIGGNAVVGEYVAPWGQQAAIVAEQPLVIHGWTGRSWQPEVDAATIQAPVSSGSNVGTIRADNGSQSLVTEGAISKPSVWWRLQNYW